MAGFNPFPRSVAERSLVYATQLEKTLRDTYARALEQKLKPPPPYFSRLQIELAHEQADEDAQEIAWQLHHAVLKLQWETDQKWKRTK